MAGKPDLILTHMQHAIMHEAGTAAFLGHAMETGESGDYPLMINSMGSSKR